MRTKAMNGHQPKGPTLDLAKIVPPQGGTGIQGPYRKPNGYLRQGEHINGSLLRLQVPGGWVVYSSASVCFIPDAEERWVLEPEQVNGDTPASVGV